MPNSAMVEATDEKSFDRSLHSFCKEARVLAALRHPNIVGIHEVFGACGTAFLGQITSRANLCKNGWQRNPPAPTYAA